MIELTITFCSNSEWRFASRAVSLAVLCFCTLASHAAAEQPKEHTLKAAYLYQFTRFVAWPDGTWRNEKEDFVIGVIGENPFGNTLDKLATKRLAQKRRIKVHYFADLAAYKPCHILFVSAAADDATREAILRQTRNQPVLVVGETLGYCDAGSTVNFVLLQGGSINIEINIDAMNRRKMQANAQLLKLAKVVRDGGA